MSKPVSIYLLAALLSAAQPAANAAEMAGSAPAKSNASTTPVRHESYGTAIANKATIGFANAFLGFVEIPKNVINTTNEANFALGITGGVLKGLLHSVGRTAHGMLDLLTFPIPTEPVPAPNLVWENFNVETRYNPVFKMKP